MDDQDPLVVLIAMLFVVAIASAILFIAWKISQDFFYFLLYLGAFLISAWVALSMMRS